MSSEGAKSVSGERAIVPVSPNAIKTAVAGQVSANVVRTALGWLEQNPELLESVVGAATGGYGNAVLQIVQWLNATIKERPVPKSERPLLEGLVISDAPNVIATLTAAESISGGAPGQIRRQQPDNALDGKRVGLLRSDRRAAIGKTRRGNTTKLVLLVPEQQAAPTDTGADTETIVVGQVTSELPKDADADDPPYVSESEHRPGRSISHEQYFAGTLGAYVTFRMNKRQLKGFFGAAHVLTAMNRANTLDKIHSPGFPDKPADAAFEYGELMNWRKLAHYTDTNRDDIILNDVDIGVARLLDDTLPVSNLVPHPNDDGSMVLVGDAMSVDDILDFTDTSAEVYMVGRSSGFRRGILKAADIKEYAIKMPNNKNYMYRNLALVERLDPNKKFSRRGDSGALVYAVVGKKCRAVGFVVGGNDRHTFICPAITCLTAMNAELLG